MVGRKIDTMYPVRECKIGQEILRVENMTVEHPTIKDRNLITDVSFNLRKGEVLGIAGLVGSGRTEILSALYGSYQIKSGRVTHNDQDTKIKNIRDAKKKGLSLVTEDRKYDGLMMQHNIRINTTICHLAGISWRGILSRRKEDEIAEKYLKKLSIKAPSIESKVSGLSGGNQQKVVIAKALSISPSILLLDEPTKGIDVGAKHEIYNIMNQLVSEGISIIMVSSELPELIAMSDRIIVMACGRCVGEVDKMEISQEKIMELAVSNMATIKCEC
jgi:ABC-type sugar transport system ATPase subunit